jgi:hypothetical protein
MTALLVALLALLTAVCAWCAFILVGSLQLQLTAFLSNHSKLISL